MKNYMFGFITWISCLAVMVSAIPAKAESISIDDAADLVTSVITETNTNMYLCQNYYGEELYWQFFVDAAPMANWGHKCYLATVPKSQEDNQEYDVSIQELSFIPDVDLEPYRINVNPNTRIIGANSENDDFFVINDPIEILPLPSQYNYNASKPGNNYAVIISGGKNKQNNWCRYWNDCSLIYRVLTKRYGFDKENIYLAISDGTDTEDDLRMRVNGQDLYMSSPLDLDFDGVDDIDYAATKSEIINIFNKLATILTKDDHLFIYLCNRSR